jgi:hypothetical protein
VWVADQSAGVARQVPVTTGAKTAEGLVEVTEGLDVTSRLIVSGRQGLSDGMRIRVVAEEANQ